MGKRTGEEDGGRGRETGDGGEEDRGRETEDGGGKRTGDGRRRTGGKRTGDRGRGTGGPVFGLRSSVILLPRSALPTVHGSMNCQGEVR
jgi:hypothetical protein